MKNKKILVVDERESLVLLEQKARVFETLFEHAPEGLMVLNVRGEPLYINRRVLEMLGYSREEALNLTLADLLAEESFQDAMESHMNFFLGRDYRKKRDVIFRAKSGEKRIVSLSVSDYRLQGDYAILSFADVTEERMSLQQLKEANERLQGLDHLKSEYINTATHELRIPVTVIYSYCSLIKEIGDENLTEEQRQYLNAALESSERLTELVNDMLDLSKLDAGKEEMNFEENNIMEPIREVYTVLAPFASRNGLDMSLEPFQESVFACFDNAHIRCVLTNLIGNAIKFTPRGGKIGVSVARDGDEVHVSVTDTGEGIPEHYVPRIFDEFCQVKSDNGSPKGTGLGLAICKRIVNAHRGKMWVVSAPRKGSRFTFSLPVSRD
ncbi:MAG: multi-sensor signal transduction histidine [Geobacteraceae bacterium]|nr:MAG: multi-sensor signal transduction histidine [Geobacteraceae bacterium]